MEKMISINELCQSIGMAHEILGTANRHVTMPSPIDAATEKSVSFCNKNEELALGIIKDSHAKVIVCSDKLNYTPENYRNKTLILVPDPRLAFLRIVREHFQEKTKFGIHPSAIIDEEAEMSPDVYIGPHTYIGRSTIGSGTIIYGNVHMYSNVKIGKNVVIDAGTVIGAEGFGYERDEKGKLEKFPHIGGVVIEDDVEIGSNVSIDRGTMGNTIIGQGSKVDNLCLIAHNVLIGKHCLITGQIAIAGSVKIGDYSWIAPCVCLREGISIGKNTIIGMGSVVTRNIGDNVVAYGVPARVVRTLSE